VKVPFQGSREENNGLIKNKKEWTTHKKSKTQVTHTKKEESIKWKGKE